MDHNSVEVLLATGDGVCERERAVEGGPLGIIFEEAHGFDGGVVVEGEAVVDACR